MAFPHEDPLPGSRLKAWFLSVGILSHEYSVYRRSTAQPPWRITASVQTAMQLLRNGVDRMVIAPYADIGLTAIRLGVRSASREMGFAKPRPGELTHSASPQADDRSRRDAESRSDSVGVGNRLRRDETNRYANRRRNDHLDDSRPDTGAGVLRNYEGTEPFEKAVRVEGIDLTPNPSPCLDLGDG